MDKSEKGYHKLLVWQKMRELIGLTYDLTGKLPKSEEFGLRSQMRRAMVSVISNFVEGYLKRSIKEKLNFLSISETSLLELEAQSEICLILNYWKEEEYLEFDKKRSEVGYFLYRYKSKINP
ncbi:four helix bundle protein [Candidatus Shapirobacteria bacterium CG08_land_8_20_14_0_20_39_18]|uniref:Four helix bundle protein n=1 Tax=Candidatus Shapirobacteria bacterium CG08_land_8_20_14_0_20_39_18 TaxID=1974883 RepID=A0A2M6XDK8_9BACT|nr:MAG: four helix bundle protein [Candidatus Shapirobacteria bacterium CG08_land_8_20_14_0_20_39_18]PIY64792.1 MAG: four helix bundle protein [Candidatus Shapirobacteria bacterium CG_4_10_14_0_8_um_filter_39_15]PJE67919.1 MAG: four helix bundle protein [Candidatus Shapirobacteria bacterium CG10_big_fil_rev_8_21_14_0_10_38_8]